MSRAPRFTTVVMQAVASLRRVREHPVFVFLLGCVLTFIVGTFLAGRKVERLVAAFARVELAADEIPALHETDAALAGQLAIVDTRLDYCCPPPAPRASAAKKPAPLTTGAPHE